MKWPLKIAANEKLCTLAKPFGEPKCSQSNQPNDDQEGIRSQHARDTEDANKICDQSDHDQVNSGQQKRQGRIKQLLRGVNIYIKDVSSGQGTQHQETADK